MLFALLLQPVAAPPTDADRFDLARLPNAASGCASGPITADIVVCGKADRHRLRPVDPASFGEQPLRAQIDVGAGKLGVGTEAGNVGGFQSNRVMVKLKLPF